ncbi:MAG TPA: choice-of-anchor B family protein [Vicinamibacterales bacterium]|nr:choice-of-anchor B family protein [Vicinamibacterales bacterium]
MQAPARLEALPEMTCTNGFAGAYPCRDVDLLSFLSHAEMGGGSGNDIWGWTDPETGHEYALVGESSGTAFVDISNPSQPIYVGSLPTHTAPSAWRGIKAFANHAFVVSEAVDHGMQVFDLTQLRNVTAPPVTFSETAHYAGFGSTHTLALNTRTGFAYAVGTRTCEGGLHVVDVRTPGTPRAAGCFSLDGYTHETQCVVYTGADAIYRDHEICLNSNEDTLTIVDATDKLEQVQLSRTGYGGSAYTHQGWLTDDQRFFLVNDEGDEQAFKHATRTWIWDVSDLDAPVLLTYYDGPTPSIDHNLYVRGNLVYESNYRSGLRVLDASQIAQGALRELGFFDIFPADDNANFNGAWTSYPFFSSGAVIVNGIEQGLFVVRPRAIPQGLPTGLDVTFSGPGTVAFGADLVLVTRVTNHASGRRTGVRVLEMPPSGAELVSVRPSQGACSTSAIATCDLGSLAPGAEAFIVVRARTTREGDVISTAIVNGSTDNGLANERHAVETMTRVARYEPSLTLRRPVSDTLFRLGRNNTVQWTMRGVAGGVAVDLSRDDGASWTRVSDNAENSGFYDWTGSGMVSSRAKIRITSVTNPELTQTSPGFSIVR